MGFDAWFAHGVCVAAAERSEREHQVPALALPAQPFGPTPEHRNFGAGFVDLPADLHGTVVTAILDSLVDQKIRRILVWRGCGEHDLAAAKDAFNRRHVGECKARLLAQPFHGIWCMAADPNIPGGHADSFATSTAMYRFPDHVHPDRIPEPAGLDVDWDEPDLDFARYSSSRVIGDPGHASTELGHRLWETSVDAVTSEIAALAVETR